MYYVINDGAINVDAFFLFKKKERDNLNILLKVIIKIKIAYNFFYKKKKR